MNKNSEENKNNEKMIKTSIQRIKVSQKDTNTTQKDQRQYANKSEKMQTLDNLGPAKSKKNCAKMASYQKEKSNLQQNT